MNVVDVKILMEDTGLQLEGIRRVLCNAKNFKDDQKVTLFAFLLISPESILLLDSCLSQASHAVVDFRGRL